MTPPEERKTVAGEKAFDKRQSPWPTRVSRRELLAAGAGCLVGLAGCLGDEAGEEDLVPNPVDLDGASCDACGMVISEHYGPSGQVFFAGSYPEGREGPAWFDSTRELFVDRFAAVDQGREPVATYVTDYSSVEYAIAQEGDDQYISTHVGDDTFVLATEAVFVVESGILGAMGPELLPFGSEEDGHDFADAQGGRVVDSEAITPDLVGRL